MKEEKERALDKSKYVFVVETEGELSGHDNKRSFVVTNYEFATNDGDGDFVLYLDIEDFFIQSSTTSKPFAKYFDGGYDRSSYCDGYRHYPVAPCPIQISVKNQETGKQAELFDFSFGRLWLYNSLEEYIIASSNILGVVIEADPNKPTGRLLHIFNKCKNLNYTTMGIALYQASGMTRLGIRILVESPCETIPGFFEKLGFMN